MRALWSMTETSLNSTSTSTPSAVFGGPEAPPDLEPGQDARDARAGLLRKTRYEAGRFFLCASAPLWLVFVGHGSADFI